MSIVSTISANAAKAAKQLIRLSEQQKNTILADIASALRTHESEILQANKIDMQNAHKDGLDEAMLDRLLLTPDRIEAMAAGVEVVASLPDPVGEIRKIETRPNGIEVSKMRIPLGVVCMIYEARPNVTADAGALCFKSGNGIILRGGKEALNSSLAISKVMQEVLIKHGLPKDVISVIPNPDRELMLELMQQKDYIDVIIPRGGEGLINFVTENSLVPVIQHFKGVCHLFVDESANLDKALNLLLNGKTQRTGVCNALECLLVHKDIAEQFLPVVAKSLSSKQVKVNACSRSIKHFDGATELADSEFGVEYLRSEIAIRIVDDINAAIEHIDEFGSYHTEVICTEDNENAVLFQQCVDASVVMVNASSRFSDGGELGLGAEIGIATTKLHAYGPMGIESLTTEKYLVNGDGQIRA